MGGCRAKFGRWRAFSDDGDPSRTDLDRPPRPRLSGRRELRLTMQFEVVVRVWSSPFGQARRAGSTRQLRLGFCRCCFGARLDFDPSFIVEDRYGKIAKQLRIAECAGVYRIVERFPKCRKECGRDIKATIIGKVPA